MLLINLIARIIAVLRSAATPGQIAVACMLGMVAGLTPSIIITVLIMLLLIIFNVNMTAGLLSVALFKLAAFAADPLLHSIGYRLLAGTPQLNSLWTTLYNTPFVPLTRFNNTVVIGSFATALVLMLPLFFAVRWFVIEYRGKYDEKIQNLKVVRYLKTLKMFQLYGRLKKIGDSLW
jgi:uncharacterized protein (TIGR03546 family)